MHISRRHIFAAAPALALGACTITKSNGVTTGTMDTKTIQQDVQALLTAGSQVLATPNVSAALGNNLPTAQTALASANTAFAGITAQLAPSVSLSLDTTSVQNAVKSVLADIGTVLSLVTPVVALVPGGAAVNVIIGAAQTLIPFIELAAQLAATKPMATEPGAEAVALRTIYGR